MTVNRRQQPGRTVVAGPRQMFPKLSSVHRQARRRPSVAVVQGCRWHGSKKAHAPKAAQYSCGTSTGNGRGGYQQPRRSPWLYPAFRNRASMAARVQCRLGSTPGFALSVQQGAGCRLPASSAHSAACTTGDRTVAFIKAAARRQTPAMAAVRQAAAAAAAWASATAAVTAAAQGVSTSPTPALGLAGANEGSAGGVSGRGAGPEGEAVTARSSSTAAAAAVRPASFAADSDAQVRRVAPALGLASGDSSSAPLILRLSEAQAAATSSSAGAQSACWLVLMRGRTAWPAREHTSNQEQSPCQRSDAQSYSAAAA